MHVDRWVVCVCVNVQVVDRYRLREGAWIFRPAFCSDPRLDPRPCAKVTRYRRSCNT